MGRPCGGAFGRCVCILLFRSVVALPIKGKQKHAMPTPQHFTKEKTFVFKQTDFLKPQPVASLELLDVPVGKGFETKSNFGKQFRVASSRTSTGSRIAIVAGLAILLLVCAFLICSSGEGDAASVSSAPSQQSLEAMTSCNGTWARTYQKANKQDKQALELLFRCQIIPEEEFAHSVVSQAHIDECVWLATIMIRQRPLEEWLVMSAEAQRTFDSNAATCFVARQEGKLSPGPSPRSTDEMHNTAASADIHKTFAKAVWTDPLAMSASSVEGNSLVSSQVDYDVLNSSEDSSLLMMRCRQIMAATDAQRKPYSSMPAIGESSPAQVVASKTHAAGPQTPTTTASSM